MLVGITLFGRVTASLASMFVENDEGPAEDYRRLQEQLERIASQLEALEDRLVDQRGAREGEADS